ncbi:hypothetical protein GCM10011309_01840 [Litorimonas cladophorae]|uniref:Uncharacterized protein n=1 Tax=Litorimonas cladophorae TaxID=1220491 RepID=A0A918KAI3_9PROT|nr:hypothetical protein [Litorimonas cladophorae]GGX56625.1 hypothetical protein GCM10011309_01840 [Litorimonas cladophorae]
MTEIVHTPYTPWPERKCADPRVANQAQYVDGLTEILSYQAPMQAVELFQAYGKAAGLLKIAASVRRRFEYALNKAEKSGDVVIVREKDPEAKSDDDSVQWIVRLPHQPPVIVRDLGTRGFAEIPMSELAAVVLDIRSWDELAGREDIYRAVLEHYGLQKLTALVKRRLNAVLEQYF